jgi:class 3 adenylate cyclase
MKPPEESDFAHVLFMDLVGFSRHPMNKQKQFLKELQEALRSTPVFQRAEARGKLLRMPTGDGMALAFFGDPVAPVECALELARELRKRPQIALRMGVNNGPVHRIVDINGNENISGGGINYAQRVMDCGDAGHILVSKNVAELLQQLGGWDAYLHDLGECKVKHGERLHLFNLVHEEVGNPLTPEKLHSAPPQNAPADPLPAGAAMRVALLYKRNAEPDDYVLKLLETQLHQQGHQVFIDRHMAIGKEWAAEIERQIRESDAVIPLLSAASVQSEMLEYELQTAHQAAQGESGKPRILPVRVRFDASLSGPIASILNPLHYALWQSPQDDARLVDEVISALRQPPAARAPLESVGGAVPLDSKFYIVRPADARFTAAVTRQDSIVLVKGARQMGKTSLLARGLQQAREAGAKTAVTDFQELDMAHLASANTFFLALAATIARQLKLPVSPRELWDEDMSANDNMQEFLCSSVLAAFSEPFVWGLDEVDRLSTCPFGSGVFALFRSWHNRRALDPAGPWSRLTLAIAYATEAQLFITDLNQSPFNVGTRLTLEDFTPEQVGELNRRYGSPLRAAEALNRFYRLVSGHPYLVRRGLDAMVTGGLDIDALEAQASRDDGVFGDHLRRLLISLTRDPELTEIVRGILRGGDCPTHNSFYRLRGAGVVTGSSARDAAPRCQLYAAYLEQHLL